MFQNITVKNFRGLGSVLLHPLGRVNLIAGKNNTGKSALLEAIYLFCNPSDCRLPLEVNKARGIEMTNQEMEEVCSWLFYDRQLAHQIEITSQVNGDVGYLNIALVDRLSMREQFPEGEKVGREAFRAELWDSNVARLVLRYRWPGGGEKYAIGVAGMGFIFTPPRSSWSVPSVFLSSAAFSPAEDVRRFGELEGAKRQEEILSTLRTLEPNLQRLSLILFAGKPCIHGDIGLSRMIPVPFLGEGFRRLLSIVLAIASATGGVVLIDEVENGFHYSVMQEVWAAIAQAARKANAQVFATTHSFECIRAAHLAFKEDRPYEFRYHRLDRRRDEIVVRTFDEGMLDAVETSDLEIR
jgi:ABC-type branched-subunit amino acid transport system ATPase component